MIGTKNISLVFSKIRRKFRNSSLILLTFPFIFYQSTSHINAASDLQEAKSIEVYMNTNIEMSPQK